MQKFLRPSQPGAAAYRNWQFLRLSGARGSAASSCVRAVAPRPPRSCGQESLRNRFLAKNLAYALDHYCSRNLAIPFSFIFRRGFGIFGYFFGFCTLLINPRFCNTHGQRSHAGDHTYPLRYRDCTPCVENIKQMRTLQTQVVRREHRELCRTSSDIAASGCVLHYSEVFLHQRLALGLVKLEVLHVFSTSAASKL